MLLKSEPCGLDRSLRQRLQGFVFLLENDPLNTPGTYSPDRAVPQDRRAFGGRDLFSLWFSLGIGLMVLQTGALLAPGLGLSGSLLAIFLGTLVGVSLLASVGVIGSDTGLYSTCCS